MSERQFTPADAAAVYHNLMEKISRSNKSAFGHASSHIEDIRQELQSMVEVTEALLRQLKK